MKAAQLISQELEARGLDSNFSESENDYGQSCYFVFWKDGFMMKIRISDHSVTNRVRMQMESCYDCFKVNEVVAKEIADDIEYFLHPERFKMPPAKYIEMIYGITCKRQRI